MLSVASLIYSLILTLMLIPSLIVLAAIVLNGRIERRMRPIYVKHVQSSDERNRYK